MKVTPSTRDGNAYTAGVLMHKLRTAVLTAVLTGGALIVQATAALAGVAWK